MRAFLFLFLLGVGAVAGVLLVTSQASGLSREGRTPTDDCGLLALYHLLHLEGREAGLEAIRSQLPPRRPDGHSLRELRDAAGRLGLGLNAVVVPRDSPPGTPIVLLIKPDRTGHFLVVRPVGHTGRLIQVLNGVDEPVVVDWKRFATTTAWTGIALAPRGVNGIARWSFAAACVGFLAFLGRMAHRRRNPTL